MPFPFGSKQIVLADSLGTIQSLVAERKRELDLSIALRKKAAEEQEGDDVDEEQEADEDDVDEEAMQKAWQKQKPIQVEAYDRTEIRNDHGLADVEDLMQAVNEMDNEQLGQAVIDMSKGMQNKNTAKAYKVVDKQFMVR